MILGDKYLFTIAKARVNKRTQPPPPLTHTHVSGLYHVNHEIKVQRFHYAHIKSYYNSSSVCLCVCSLCTPRSFDGSSPNLVGVCRLTSHLPLRGSFSKRSTASRVNGSLSLSTILYMRQPHSTRCNGAFCFAVAKQQSLILRLFLQCISTLYVGAPRNCY